VYHKFSPADYSAAVLSTQKFETDSVIYPLTGATTIESRLRKRFNAMYAESPWGISSGMDCDFGCATICCLHLPSKFEIKKGSRMLVNRAYKTPIVCMVQSPLRQQCQQCQGCTLRNLSAQQLHWAFWCPRNVTWFGAVVHGKFPRNSGRQADVPGDQDLRLLYWRNPLSNLRTSSNWLTVVKTC